MLGSYWYERKKRKKYLISDSKTLSQKKLQKNASLFVTDVREGREVYTKLQ